MVRIGDNIDKCGQHMRCVCGGFVKARSECSDVVESVDTPDMGEGGGVGGINSAIHS
jgi:hypothetical protein